MARYGRCHCGHILQFHRGSEGFKVRCPRCGSVVRLQSPERRSKAASRSSPHAPGDSPPGGIELEPLEMIELVPLSAAPGKFWTGRTVVLLLLAGAGALFVGASICWLVWVATRGL
jgi:hypothetical protein